MVAMVTFQFDSGSVDVPKSITVDRKRYTLFGVEESKNKSKINNTISTINIMKKNKIYSGSRQRKYGNGKFTAFFVRK